MSKFLQCPSFPPFPRYIRPKKQTCDVMARPVSQNGACPEEARSAIYSDAQTKGDYSNMALNRQVTAPPDFRIGTNLSYDRIPPPKDGHFGVGTRGKWMSGFISLHWLWSVMEAILWSGHPSPSRNDCGVTVAMEGLPMSIL